MFGPVKEVEDFHPMKKSLARCKIDYRRNKKTSFFLTELKNLRIAGTGSLKSRGVTLKSDISIICFLKVPLLFYSNGQLC
jgi:hypothetical protein